MSRTPLVLPRVSVTLAVLTAIAALLPSTEARADEGVVQAIWKTQDIDFYYRGFTTLYTCGGLVDRLQRLLLAVGARPKDLDLRITGCSPFEGPSRSLYVHIRLSTPVEATPANLAEREKDNGFRELRARVRNEKPESKAPFAAYWKSVILAPGKFDLTPGECEIVEQLARDVLPKLAIRVTKKEVRCLANQIGVGRPRVEFLALTVAPLPNAPSTTSANKPTESRADND